MELIPTTNSCCSSEFERDYFAASRAPSDNTKHAHLPANSLLDMLTQKLSRLKCFDGMEWKVFMICFA